MSLKLTGPVMPHCGMIRGYSVVMLIPSSNKVAYDNAANPENLIIAIISGE